MNSGFFEFELVKKNKPGPKFKHPISPQQSDEPKKSPKYFEQPRTKSKRKYFHKKTSKHQPTTIIEKENPKEMTVEYKASKRPHLEESAFVKESLENIFNYPGLQHLAEKIFLNLDYEDLEKCQLINQSTTQILQSIFLAKEVGTKRTLQGEPK